MSPISAVNCKCKDRLTVQFRNRNLKHASLATSSSRCPAGRDGSYNTGRVICMCISRRVVYSLYMFLKCTGLLCYIAKSPQFSKSMYMYLYVEYIYILHIYIIYIYACIYIYTHTLYIYSCIDRERVSLVYVHIYAHIHIYIHT